MRYEFPAWDVGEAGPSSAAFAKQVGQIRPAPQPEPDHGDALGALDRLSYRTLLSACSVFFLIVGVCLGMLL